MTANKRPVKRGPRGMGTVFQLDNGRWGWQASLGTDPRTGRRIRLSAERATREEVLLAREAKLAELMRSGPAKPSTPGSVADWLDEWLRHVQQRPGGAPSTYANYEGACRVHIVPAIGGVQLSALTSDQVSKMLEGKTVPTRRMVHKTLSTAWTEAWEAQRVDDPFVVRRVPTVLPGIFAASGAARPRTREEEDHALLTSLEEDSEDKGKEGMRAEDQVAVMRTIEGHRLRARWLVGIVFGSRQSEALGLAWPDLRVLADGSGKLSIRRERVRQAWAHGCSPLAPCGKSPARCPHRIALPRYKETKTAGSTRIVTLSPAVVVILLEWRAQQAIEMGMLKGPPPRIPWMFTNADGTPLSHSADRKAWQAVLKKAGVSRHYSLHDMRHTAASEAASNLQIDGLTMMTMFGWTKRATADLYSHARNDRLSDAWGRQQDSMIRPR